MTTSQPLPLRTILLLNLLVISLAACSALAPAPTATATPRPSPSPSSSPTVTPSPTATAIRTPPALPTPFQSSLLKSRGTPHTYIADTCQYLKDKWSSANSAPGTVAIAVMIHGIVAEDIIPTADQITESGFREMIGALMNKEYEAITTVQLADFLENNAKIPPRSVLLIADDRHHKQYFNEYFREYWNADGWPVVNAYISAERDGNDASIFKEQEEMNAEGWVDYQAHGVVHNTPMWPGVSDAYITGELQGSIDAFQAHFNKTPIAIIWPGGGFSPRWVEIARQLGYRLGFTTSPRGPLMFDWIPLSDTADPRWPSWTPEGPVDDPLLVLPRYWDTDLVTHLDTIVQISQEAAAYAEQNKATELEYYDIVCAPQYGPVP